MQKNKINLVFFASGGGSNVEAILKNIESGQIRANPAAIITNNSYAGVVEKVLTADIPYYHISSVTHPDEHERTRIILEVLERHNADLIILAGYMKKLPEEIIIQYENRILNIHPALLPKFGGKNMYGMNVHRAVLESNEKKSGATVHIVNSEYDKGKILAQKSVEVKNNDNPETLRKRVLKAEHTLYSEVISKVISGDINLKI